ncbi:MAG: response regulator [Oscillochloris sp.]|nr:response regulator [Oscillochloris sp.]
MQPSLLPLRGLSILIVEDSAEIAFDLSDGLRQAGAASVELKASVRQARKRLETPPPPSIVLLDNNLVGVETGLDLALWIRTQPRLTQALRISYSGSDPAQIQANCPDSHVFHALIIKPIPLPTLITQIADLAQANYLFPLAR